MSCILNVKKVIEYFEKNHSEDFDLYGHWWPASYKNYKGWLIMLVNVYQTINFAFCYENMRDVQGYITEKSFNCFAVGCVPIYWGASNITDYIPADCFIDRRKFASNEEVYQFIKSMTQQEYDNYIVNILRFMQSDMALKFTSENLWKTVEQALLN